MSQDIVADNCLGLAAQLAFYVLLALFPALLFLVALFGYLPIENAFGELLVALRSVAPEELIALLQGNSNIGEGNGGGLLTLGIVGAIWSSSAAMVATIDALNRAYDVPERRSWQKRRLVAISLTVALPVCILIALSLVIVGPALAIRIANWLGMAEPLAVPWSLIRWPPIVLVVIVAMDLVYHFRAEPPRQLGVDHSRVSPTRDAQTPRVRSHYLDSPMHAAATTPAPSARRPAPDRSRRWRL